MWNIFSLFQIKVEIESTEKYDASNALVLPSAKRATKKLRDKSAGPVRLLSKKKRKHLEKIVDQKEKKAKVKFASCRSGRVFIEENVVRPHL